MENQISLPIKPYQNDAPHTGSYIVASGRTDPRILYRIAMQATEVLSRYDYDAIAFQGMSGALIAPILALTTGKGLILVRKPNDSTHSKELVEGLRSPRRYIIVDDFIAFGDTVRRIIEAITLYAPKAECLGVLLTNRLLESSEEKRAYQITPIP